MAISRLGGYPDYNSQGTIGFIPEVWSAKLIEQFLPSCVFSEIASTDYQGEIKGKGDNIIIRTEPDVTVIDYSGVGSNFSQSDYQVPQSTLVELPIDKAKAILIRLNTVDAAQSDLDLPSVFAKKASEKLNVAMDLDVLANIPAQAAAQNVGATAGIITGGYNLGTAGAPVQITSSNALDKLLDANAVLDEQNVPREGRWAVIPSRYARMLKSSDLKQAYLTGDDTSPIRNGKIGEIDGLTIYQSNNLPLSADGTPNFSVMVGHSLGLAWAAQITEVESLPNPNDFGQLMRVLAVYGYKVINPKTLAVLKAYF